MSGKTRLSAQPIKKILDQDTGELVGWLYAWNTGEREPMWCDGAKTNVRYEDVEDSDLTP